MHSGTMTLVPSISFAVRSSLVPAGWLRHLTMQDGPSFKFTVDQLLETSNFMSLAEHHCWVIGEKPNRNVSKDSN